MMAWMAGTFRAEESKALTVSANTGFAKQKYRMMAVNDFEC